MKRIVFLVLSAIFLYAFLRDFSIVRTLLISVGIAGIYAVCQVPSRFILNARYPLIGLSLALSVLFFFYPRFITAWHLDPALIFVSFYALALYLAALETQTKGFVKEAVAMAALLLSVFLNLSMAGRIQLALPVSLAVLLFLFILNRVRLLPIAALFGLAAIVFAKKEMFVGGTAFFNEEQRYLVLAMTLLFLVLSFISMVKESTPMKLISFFGFLCIALDVLLVVGFKFSAGLATTPVTVVILSIPLLGVTLKSEAGGRA